MKGQNTIVKQHPFWQPSDYNVLFWIHLLHRLIAHDDGFGEEHYSWSADAPCSKVCVRVRLIQHCKLHVHGCSQVFRVDGRPMNFSTKLEKIFGLNAGLPTIKAVRFREPRRCSCCSINIRLGEESQAGHAGRLTLSGGYGRFSMVRWRFVGCFVMCGDDGGY